jgi:hypothetical protein
MMDSDTDAYPRRRWNYSERDKYVALLIDQLRELESKTDPKKSAQSAKGKDLAALAALEIAGNLVNALAGWALDHQAGLALEDLEFVPLGTSQTKKHPDYQTNRSMVDDHRHERNGGNGGGPLDPIVARKCLVNLLRANPGGFDPRLIQMTISALEARDYNETQPMLRATKKDRKVNRTILNIQLRAIAFVKYREARGLKKFKALEQVAGALGVSDETVRSWQPRLQTEFGPLKVVRALTFAENAGKNQDDAERRGFAGQWDDRYGPGALQELARQFKAATTNK